MSSWPGPLALAALLCLPSLAQAQATPAVASASAASAPALTPAAASAPPSPAPAVPPAVGPPPEPAAPEAPDSRGAEGVLVDVERIVGAEESSGWFLDSSHLTSLYPVVLQTVCRATPAARRQALAALEERAQAAGDPHALYEASGRKMTDAVEKALRQARERDVLRASVAGAERDCPFWVEPVPGYDGRQTYRNRFVLTFESGGLVQLRRTQGNWTYGGGGVGRFLVGYNFGGKATLLGGGEFAGGAMLRPGEGKAGFVINYFPAVPVVLRVHAGSWHYDFEAAGVALFQADDPHFSFGTRAGFAVGVSALRTRFFIPWAGAAIAYEHYFAGGGRATQEFLRAGLRIGAVLDL